MLNPNAKPYHYQKKMIHIMSPTAYYNHKACLPPPLQLFHTLYPNPSIPPTPQFTNSFYQKPSLYYSSMPPPPPPPPHHDDQQQPLHHVSAKTQEYYRLMQQISNDNKRPAMSKRKKTTATSSTSVMMRNIPSSISREMLMEIVDQHCIDENKKALTMSSHGDHQQDAILSEYDFIYLPMDFMRRRKSNLGYAFLNFTTSVAATRFYKSFDNLSWKDSMNIDSPKICKICPARIQGKKAHVGHFKNCNFKCDLEDFLPMSFSPPRNGSTSQALPSLLGKLVGKAQKKRKSRKMKMHM